MEDFTAALATALALIVGFDRDLVGIVSLSLLVSMSAVSLAAVCGLPLERRWRYAGFPDVTWWEPCSMP